MIKNIFLVLFTSLFISSLLCNCGKSGSYTTAESNHKFEDFTEVKKLLLGKVYYDHRRTLYCDCTFSKKKRVRCKVGKGKRASRIEWEHIVPASRFGNTFAEWRSEKSWHCSLPKFVRQISGMKCRKISGRENARRNSKEYRLMESDMYNLAPAVGLINQKRAAKEYGIIFGEKREFGSCDFEVSAQCVEPREDIRGQIARAYLYMAAAYPKRVRLTAKERAMFTEWDKEYPVSRWECQRARRIKKIQGNINPFVAEKCK